MKILVYVPLAPMTPRIYARSMTSIMTLQWYEPLDIMFGKHDMTEYPGHDAGYLNLLEKHNRARDLVLSGGYDALFLAESDMILPTLALERLAQIDADVAYGLYVSRHGAHQWLAFDHISEKPYSGASLSADKLLAQAAWGQAVETQGVGMGCTLIHRHVLEAMPFRCPDTQVADDWFFSLDCKTRGFRQVTDCGTVCGHIQGAPDPKIFWPEADGSYSVQFFDNPQPKQASTFSVNVGGDRSVEIFPMPQEAN